MSDIDILNPEARRFIIVRRPDAPTQRRVDVPLDRRVGQLNGDVERMRMLEDEIAKSNDLRSLLDLAAAVRNDASWAKTVGEIRIKAESLLKAKYPPAGSAKLVVEKTPPFAESIVALAGTALYLARQGRPIRSPAYLDAVFVAWLFKTGIGSSVVPRELRDNAVFVWGQVQRTPNPDDRPANWRLRTPAPNTESLRREAASVRNLLLEFYGAPESRSAPLSINALAALRGVAPTLSEHVASATVADAIRMADAVISFQPSPTPSEPLLMGVHIGDLYVTRTQLDGYQIADISRIETILANETRERTHTRRTLVETEEKTEDEQIRETESDLQQTTRDEVRTEQRKQEESESQVSAGGRVSASYGTFLTVEAHADFSSKSSKSVAESVARTTSNETTRKAIDKARSRFLRQMSTRRLEEVIEQNRHSFTSATGTGGDRQGFYRWLEKRIKVSLFNLGGRTIYTFAVEDPSAGYRAASASAMPAPPSPPVVECSLPFPWPFPGVHQPPRPLQPGDITRVNYLGLLAAQEAGEGQPPPPEFQTASISLARTGKDGSDVQKELELPDGYECYEIRGVARGADYAYSTDSQSETNKRDKDGIADLRGVFNGMPYMRIEHEETSRDLKHVQPTRQGNTTVHVTVAGRHSTGDLNLKIGSTTTAILTALGPKVSVSAISLGDVTVDVTFYCRLQVEIFEAWQLAVYRAIMAAYAARRARYDEAVAGMTRTSVEVTALRAEIKRLALRGVLRGVSPPAAVRLFVQQAFDWDNIAYQFIDGETFAPPSPIGSALGAFLRAVVARIDVAVRPGFEGLVAAYMQGAADIVPDNPVSEDGGTGLDAALEAPINERPKEGLVTTWTELLLTDLIFVQKGDKVKDVYDADGNRVDCS